MYHTILLYKCEPFLGVLHGEFVHSLRGDAPVNHLGGHVLQKMAVSMTPILHLQAKIILSLQYTIILNLCNFLTSKRYHTIDPGVLVSGTIYG